MVNINNIKNMFIESNEANCNWMSYMYDLHILFRHANGHYTSKHNLQLLYFLSSAAAALQHSNNPCYFLLLVFLTVIITIAITYHYNELWRPTVITIVSVIVVIKLCRALWSGRRQYSHAYHSSRSFLV